MEISINRYIKLKNMPDYGKGKIYKIINDVNNEMYVGSTIKTLSRRMQCHRADSKKQTRRPKSKLYIVMRELGVDHFRIILLENYATDSKDKLNAREQFYIDELKPSLNSRSAVLDTEHRINYSKDVLTCTCGKQITRFKMNRHEKSKQHLEFINQIN